MATFGLIAVIIGCSRSRPATPGFIVAQLVGAAAATAVFCWLYPAVPAGATVAGTVPPGDSADRPKQQ